MVLSLLSAFVVAAVREGEWLAYSKGVFIGCLVENRLRAFIKLKGAVWLRSTLAPNRKVLLIISINYNPFEINRRVLSCKILYLSVCRLFYNFMQFWLFNPRILKSYRGLVRNAIGII